MATLYKYLKGSCMKKGKKSDACTSRGSDVMDRRRERLPEGAGRAVTAWWAGSRAACPQPARGFQPWPGLERGALGRSSQGGIHGHTWLRCGGGQGGTFPNRRWSCPSTGGIHAGTFLTGSGRSLGSMELPHGSRWPGRARPPRSLCHPSFPNSGRGLRHPTP